ncbi:MAG: hypothetical protein NTV63_01070 [Candidatus Woesearchaeota archaeon]|nr:hypothetical protein [Candidatus Woesearchaeota archaeon]
MDEEKMPEEAEQEKIPEKDSYKNLTIIILVIVALFSALIIGARYVMNLPEKYETYYYNGFTFTKIGPLWYTQIQHDTTLYDVALHFSPRELESVPISGKESGFSNDTTLYITFDPKAENMSYVALANAELSQVFAMSFNRNMTVACLSKEDPLCESMPIINCTNTDKPVILFEESGEASVIVNRNCVMIKGSRDNLVKAADKFILSYYGIM